MNIDAVDQASPLQLVIARGIRTTIVGGLLLSVALGCGPDSVCPDAGIATPPPDPPVEELALDAPSPSAVAPDLRCTPPESGLPPVLARGDATEYQPGLAVVGSFGDRVVIGTGVNTLFEGLAGTCVEPVTVSSPIAIEDPTLSRAFDFELATSSTSIETALRVSAAGALSLGVWSAEASASYSRSEFNTSDTTHLVVLHDWTGTTERTTAANWRLTAESVAELGEDPAAFLRRCGNQFVTSIDRGGRFRAVVRFEHASSALTERLNASVAGARQGLARGDLNFGTSLDATTSSMEHSVHILTDGGSNDPLPITVSEAIARARTASDAGRTGSIVRFDTLSYAQLANFPRGAPLANYERERAGLRQLLAAVRELRVRRNDAMDLVGRLERETATTCVTARNAQIRYVQALDRAIGLVYEAMCRCQLGEEDCGTIAEAPAPPANVPQACLPTCTGTPGATYAVDVHGYCVRCSIDFGNSVHGLEMSGDRYTTMSSYSQLDCGPMWRGARVRVSTNGSAVAHVTLPNHWTSWNFVASIRGTVASSPFTSETGGMNSHLPFGMYALGEVPISGDARFFAEVSIDRCDVMGMERDPRTGPHSAWMGSGTITIEDLEAPGAETIYSVAAPAAPSAFVEDLGVPPTLFK